MSATIALITTQRNSNPFSLRRLLAVVLGCAAAAACGSSVHRPARSRRPVAQRVCGRVAAAVAGPAHRRVTLRIADHDPANVECVVSYGAAKVDSVAEASPRAWTEYDTTAVHLAQAFGSGGVHVASQLPHSVSGVSGNATWVPAQNELVATNGTQSRGGSYVTVTVTGTPPPGTSSLALARAAAAATLASAPRGPNPGPPPS